MMAGAPASIGRELVGANPQTSLGKQALEVSHVAAKYALEASLALSQQAFVHGKDASKYLGGHTHQLAVHSWPLITDAADGACHLAAEAVGTSLVKFKGCLQREETSSSLASEEDEPVCELPLSAKLAMNPWLQPAGSLQRALSLGSQHGRGTAAINPFMQAGPYASAQPQASRSSSVMSSTQVPYQHQPGMAQSQTYFPGSSSHFGRSGSFMSSAQDAHLQQSGIQHGQARLVGASSFTGEQNWQQHLQQQHLQQLSQQHPQQHLQQDLQQNSHQHLQHLQRQPSLVSAAARSQTLQGHSLPASSSFSSHPPGHMPRSNSVMVNSAGPSSLPGTTAGTVPVRRASSGLQPMHGLRHVHTVQ